MLSPPPCVDQNCAKRAKGAEPEWAVAVGTRVMRSALMSAMAMSSKMRVRIMTSERIDQILILHAWPADDDGRQTRGIPLICSLVSDPPQLSIGAVRDMG